MLSTMPWSFLLVTYLSSPVALPTPSKLYGVDKEPCIFANVVNGWLVSMRDGMKATYNPRGLVAYHVFVP